MPSNLLALHLRLLEGAGIVADLDTRVRTLLVELVPDIELPPSVLDQG